MKKLIGFIGSGLLALVGVGFLCLSVYTMITAFRDTGFNITAPGSTTVKISKPGKYTLWNQTSAFTDGKFMTFPEQIPSGATFKMTKKPEGTQIALRQSLGTTMEINGVKRVSVAELTFDAPGDYEFAVTGFTEQRALYLDESKFARTFLKIVATVGLGIFFIVLGVGLAIFLAVTQAKTKTPTSI